MCLQKDHSFPAAGCEPRASYPLSVVRGFTPRPCLSSRASLPPPARVVSTDLVGDPVSFGADSAGPYTPPAHLSQQAYSAPDPYRVDLAHVYTGQILHFRGSRLPKAHSESAPDPDAAAESDFEPQGLATPPGST